MTIVVLAAEPFEIEGFCRKLEGRRQEKTSFGLVHVGKWQEQAMVCAAGGMGFRAAREAAVELIGRYRPDWLISAGLCGALVVGLQPGQVVTGREVIEGESGERFPAQGWAGQAVRVVSQDRVASTPGEKRALAEWGEVVEMEAAPAARVCRESGVRFGCIKAVSDGAEEGFSIDLNAARRDDGTLATASVVRSILERPRSAVPEAIRLYRRSRGASRRLTEYLEGELLGLCRV